MKTESKRFLETKLLRVLAAALIGTIAMGAVWVSDTLTPTSANSGGIGTTSTPFASGVFQQVDAGLVLANSVVQNGNNVQDTRIDGSCSAGQAVSAINNNAPPTCTAVSGAGSLAGSWAAEDIGSAVAGGLFTGAYRHTVAGAMDNVTCSWQIAGAVSGNMVVHVQNQTDATTLCTCTLGACTTAANTALSCACNTAYLANKNYILVVDATSNCATFPQNTICNVGLKQ